MRQLVTSTLAGEPAPEFVEKVPGANKVVVACVSGLGMAKADMSMAAGVRENRRGGGGGGGVSCGGSCLGAEVGGRAEAGKDVEEFGSRLSFAEHVVPLLGNATMQWRFHRRPR